MCEGRGTALLDGKGRPVKQQVFLELVVTPGSGAVLGEWVSLALPFQSKGQGSPLVPDAGGRLRLAGLVPGATYRLRVFEEGSSRPTILREFTVGSGQTRNLGDVELRLPK